MQTVKEWLERIRTILLSEGFKFTRLQRIKPGQYFGLVKDLKRGLQMHVRGFVDGKLEAEIEISRFYLEHARWKRPATRELASILKKHKIPFRRTEIISYPEKVGKMPRAMRDWRESLVHPLLYKFLGIYSICLGSLAILSIRMGHVLRVVATLAGLLLILLGVGIIIVVKLIEEALKS